MKVVADLEQIVEAFEATRWAVEIADPDWNLVWASPEMRSTLGQDDDCALGLGRHILETRRLAAFAAVPTASREQWLRLHVPFMLADGQSRDELRAMVQPELAHVVDEVEPRPAPPRWSFTMHIEGMGPPSALGERIIDADGRLLGTAFVFGSSLPASLLTFVARGDVGMFRRMASLVEPGQRQAAILFADLEGSTMLARRMSSSRYFGFVRGLMTAVDDAILRQNGIVGKHAGDGVVAFFLAEQAESPSAAARAALMAAREIHGAAGALEEGCAMAVAVHWGATLYMGRVATSGRLEVTALGDEVNECARMQEAARGGALLASKSLVERVDDLDAHVLGFDPAGVTYQLVSEMPGVTEKARRDAGSIAVVAL